MRFELVEIEKIDSYKVRNETVYDITVEDNHSYCVENIVVHNSLCSTRLVSGVGVPQFSAIVECANVAHGLKAHIISDGGINYVGDICKAFGANVDYVMIGSLFMGYDENEGDWLYHPLNILIKEKLKVFGMSSKEAQEKFYGGVASHRTSEGRSTVVPYKGEVKNFIQEIKGGVASAAAYVGASCLKDFPKCCRFIRVNNTHNRRLDDTN